MGQAKLKIGIPKRLHEIVQFENVLFGALEFEFS